MPNFEPTPYTLLDLKEPDIEILAQTAANKVREYYGYYQQRLQQSYQFPGGITIYASDAALQPLEVECARWNAYYWAICRRLDEVRKGDRYAGFDPTPYRLFPSSGETAPVTETPLSTAPLTVNDLEAADVATTDGDAGTPDGDTTAAAG